MAKKNTKLKISNKNVAFDLPDVDGDNKAVIVFDPETGEAGKAVVTLGGAGGSFNGNRTITRSGLPNVNVGGGTVTTFLNNLFFPAVAPSVSLAIQNPVREFGAPTGVDLSYSITQRTNKLTSIKFGNTVVPFTPVAGDGTTYAGALSSSAAANVTTAFVLSVTTDANETASDTKYVEFKNKRFWFVSSTDLLSLTDAQISDTVRAVNANEFADNRQQTRTLSPVNEYIYFVYQASFGSASFVVNGLGDNDFIEKNFTYTNGFNYPVAFKIVRKGLRLSNTFTVQVN